MSAYCSWCSFFDRSGKRCGAVFWVISGQCICIISECFSTSGELFVSVAFYIAGIYGSSAAYKEGFFKQKVPAVSIGNVGVSVGICHVLGLLF
jgi:hypothetical protein